MARIRTIKPEFPQSESMGRISRDARLLFIQLWTIADDSGRLRGNSRMLASLLFPYDDDAPSLIGGWISELVAENCIVCYVGSDGSSYIAILNWRDHQKIDKPSESKIPSPDSRILANPREASSSPRESYPLDQGPRTKERTKDQGEEGIAAHSFSRHFLSQEFQKAWVLWKGKQLEDRGKPISPSTEESQLYDLERFETDEAIEIVRYSTSRTDCKNLITNGDHRKRETVNGFNKKNLV